MGTKADLEIATTTLAARGYLKLPVPTKDTIVSEIKRLKKERNAPSLKIILIYFLKMQIVMVKIHLLIKMN